VFFVLLPFVRVQNEGKQYKNRDYIGDRTKANKTKKQRLYWIQKEGKQNKKTEIILGTERREAKQKTQQKIKQLNNIYIPLKSVLV
jgi:CRISPR/Cas system CSM-associated protein Csm5 (group 7 of RAMP superfamily)